jgi:uncharacterized protein YkwD
MFMANRWWFQCFACASLVLAFGAAPLQNARAGGIDRPRPVRHVQATPSELINAVNSLRLVYGLTPLGIHPILMQTAQSQANALLASEGAVGHSRPGGMTYTQQLLVLGYPLAGDLSLGGYRSENFVFGNNISALEAVEIWRGDEPHLNTMISPNYMDIGAGVAVGSDGTTYYVVDTARHTASGQPQDEASVMLTSTVSAPADALSQYILPVIRGTARPDGDVLHRVQYGQSLWSIAIEYGTTIKNIQALNNFDDTTVYEGQLLLVQKGATQPAPPTATAVISPTHTPGMTHTPGSILYFLSPTIVVQATDETSTPEDPGDGSILSVVLGFLLFAVVVGGGTAVWFIRDPRQAQPEERR